MTWRLQENLNLKKTRDNFWAKIPICHWKPTQLIIYIHGSIELINHFENKVQYILQITTSLAN